MATGTKAKGRTAANRRESPRRGRARARFWRIAQRAGFWAMVVVAILMAIPLVLTPLYRVIPPSSTLMLAAWATGSPVDRRWVDLGKVAPVLVKAVVMSEDGRYCSHWGVDFGALSDVLGSSGRPRGASTIAMQVARNLFLWQGRSYVRKAMEVPIAAWADLVLGKRRLMEVYLNIAEWGPGIFGVEAAAQHYFGVGAGRLSQRQAVLLVTALPNPFLRNPAEPGPRHRAIARIIERRLPIADNFVGCLGL